MASNNSNVKDKESNNNNNQVPSLEVLEKDPTYATQPKKPEQEDEMLAAMHRVISSLRSPFTFGPAVPPPQEASRSPPMITIHLVRHAEGPHNLRSIPEEERVAMLDPGLTGYGHSQSILLSERFHAMDKVTHILCSPMRRCLHTALVGFKPAIQRGIQVALFPDLREFGGGPCNTGSNLEDLVKDILDIGKDIRKDCFDRSQCSDYWFLDSGIRERDDHKIERVGRLQSMLYSLAKASAEASTEDIEIVVVTHSRIILLLEGRKDEKNSYHNAQYRSYRLATDEEFFAGVNAYALVETEESKGYIHTFPEDPEDDDEFGI